MMLLQQLAQQRAQQQMQTYAGANSSGGTSGLFGVSQQQQQQQQQQPAQQAASDDGWTTVHTSSNAADGQAPTVGHSADEVTGSWAESGTTVTDSAVSSSFHIEGLCTIPSETTPHKVSIAVLTFGALVQYVAVPRTKAAAFLQVKSRF
jgi:membrane protease subunit (stomatin/prohibitin family)